MKTSAMLHVILNHVICYIFALPGVVKVVFLLEKIMSRLEHCKVVLAVTESAKVRRSVVHMQLVPLCFAEQRRARSRRVFN